MQTSTHTNCILLRVLRKEQLISELSDAEVDLLIRQARPSRLLSTVAHLAEQEQAWEQIPTGAAQQFKSALILAEANLRTLHWELNRIQEAIGAADFPVILLKGAAYAALGLSNARGRLFGDIDILVPQQHLETVETRLNWKGWFSPYNNPYDQRYFREWMHEIPPLQHTKRGSVLDVHHSIVAPTSRIRANTACMFDTVQQTTGGFFQTLSQEDLILHSATHLFINGEFEHGCRDLYDMHTMFTEFGTDVDFYGRLTERAKETGLLKQLSLAVRYCRHFYHTEIAVEFDPQLADSDSGLQERLLHASFRRVLLPDHSSCRPTGTEAARSLLYLRSHYLRMPWSLLVPHLVRKSLRKEEKEN